MKRRPRRSTPAVVVAVLLGAVGVAVAVAVLQQLSGRVPFIPFARAAAFGQGLHIGDTAVIVAAAVAAALGIVLLACAWWPGRLTVLPLRAAEQDADARDAGVGRKALARALRVTAGEQDGVLRAAVRVRSRKVRATVHTERRDTTVVYDAVDGALTRRLDEVALARPPRLRVVIKRVARKKAA